MIEELQANLGADDAQFGQGNPSSSTKSDDHEVLYDRCLYRWRVAKAVNRSFQAGHCVAKSRLWWRGRLYVMDRGIIRMLEVKMGPSMYPVGVAQNKCFSGNLLHSNRFALLCSSLHETHSKRGTSNAATSNGCRLPPFKFHYVVS